MRYGIAAFLVAFLGAAGADAALIVDPSTIGQSVVVAATGNVVAKLESIGGAFQTQLFLPSYSGTIFYGNGPSGSAVGSEIDLGSFVAGTVLTFRLNVTGFGGDVSDFYTGPGSLNPDGFAHAAVNDDAGRTFVGFEDISGGGDFDYDDIVFSFSNVRAAPAAVPEPATWAMFIGGFGMVGGALRRRRMRVGFA